MPTGNLVMRLTDLTGQPVRGVKVKLTRMPGEPGTGGEVASVELAGPDPDLIITGISCRGGIGTMYKVTATTDHYRPYAFFQRIQEDRDNTASDDVMFWVKTGDVADVVAPSFDDLSASVRRILNSATMVREKAEDEDLLGLAGRQLYQAFGPLRKACFLNVVAKAAHVLSVGDNYLPLVFGLLVARQDRCFAYVDGDWAEALRQNPHFVSAPGALHDPLPGFHMTGDSFKSRDPHGNLQVTFMQDDVTGEFAADIDIDESSGIEHGFEVIRNRFRGRTNPYLIREFMLASDLIDLSLDPGYRFKF